MNLLRHTQYASIPRGGFALVMVFFVACQQPYSPATYRKQSQSQQYAMICHNDKQTLRVPAEEWPSHKAHGDYRGPCRPTKVAGKLQPEKVKHTVISYTDAKPREKESYAQWAAQKAIKDAYIDSLKTAHQHAQEEKE